MAPKGKARYGQAKQAGQRAARIVWARTGTARQAWCGTECLGKAELARQARSGWYRHGTEGTGSAGGDRRGMVSRGAARQARRGSARPEMARQARSVLDR